MQVPAMTAQVQPSVAPVATIAPELSLPIYRIRRKVFKFLGGEFHITDPQGQRIMFSKQKAFKLKEDIRVWSCAQPDREMLSIQARQVIDFGASYDVFDPQAGVKVGSLKRRGLKSILRDEWAIFDAWDQQIGAVKEDSTALALVRRFLTNLIPQSFDGFVGECRVFHFKQHFNPFVAKMTLDFTLPDGDLLDRRLGLAAAVLLCAIEGRQE